MNCLVTFLLSLFILNWKINLYTLLFSCMLCLSIIYSARVIRTLKPAKTSRLLPVCPLQSTDGIDEMFGSLIPELSGERAEVTGNACHEFHTVGSILPQVCQTLATLQPQTPALFSFYPTTSCPS